MERVFWCLLPRNQPLTFVDLFPLVEKTENSDVYCVFSHDIFGHELTLQDGVTILMILDFDWLLISYHC